MGRVGRISFLLIGAGLLGLLLTQIDLVAVRTHLHEMKWAFPLILLPYGAVYLCDALGWKFAFGRPPPIPFHTLFLTRMAGEALNNLTPFAYMGGEPVKAHLLTRFQIPMVEGMAAAIIAKLMMSTAQVLFILLGGILATSYLVARLDLLWALGGIVIGAGVLLAGLWHGLQVGFFTWVHRLLGRWNLTLPIFERWREPLHRLDQTIAAFSRHHPRRLLLSFACYTLGWLLGTLEVFTIFYAVGLPIGLPEALAIEAFASVAKGMAFFIPGSLGVQEGGNVLILGAFGFTSGLGITFSLLRRVRELVWISVGLLVLLRYYGWAWRRGGAPV
ncbi:MAG: flippase-like domain-containing protein [Nitrospinae bacterium]|nr:flippase-like domain-containing protein [Nitrospinota bacterium]